MANNTFKYSISERGQWYSIIIKTGSYFIEILKMWIIPPFSFCILLLLFSCNTQKKVTEKIVKKDSIIYVTKLKVDTVKITETKTISEPVNNDIVIPCDSLKYYQELASGKTRIIIKKEKGLVRIIYKKDPSESSNKEVYKNSVQKNDSIKVTKSETSTKNKIVLKKTFWQKITSDIWRLLFFSILILWVIGITPGLIIRKIFNV